jgi:hypothetical protein
MSTTRELGKYEVVPTVEQLMAIVEFFEKHVTDSGRVNFTQNKMIDDPIIDEHFNSPSYLNGVNTYLTNEGFINKVEIGSRHMNSVWDVSKLLKDWENVLTREQLGTSKPVRDENEKLIVPKDVEVEVVRNESKGIRTEEVNVVTSKVEAPKKKLTYQPPVVPKSNNAVMEELRNAMSDMMGYLQNLPVEMGGHLRQISSQLDLTDETAYINLKKEHEELREKYGNLQVKYDNTVSRLTADKKELEDEVLALQAQVEEASNRPSVNTHQIYRQRNAIMDEVDRMINAPAWSMKQNKVHYRNEIENLLDEIMGEMGIEKE